MCTHCWVDVCNMYTIRGLALCLAGNGTEVEQQYVKALEARSCGPHQTVQTALP